MYCSRTQTFDLPTVHNLDVFKLQTAVPITDSSDYHPPIMQSFSNGYMGMNIAQPPEVKLLIVDRYFPIGLILFICIELNHSQIKCV